MEFLPIVYPFFMCKSEEKFLSVGLSVTKLRNRICDKLINDVLAPPILHQAKQQVNVFSLIPLFSNSFNHLIVSPLLDAPKSIYLFMGYLDFSTVLTWVEGKWVKSNNVWTFSKLPFTSNNFEPLLFDNSILKELVFSYV